MLCQHCQMKFNGQNKPVLIFENIDQGLCITGNVFQEADLVLDIESGQKQILRIEYPSVTKGINVKQML
jgi:hypothetical protein